MPTKTNKTFTFIVHDTMSQKAHDKLQAESFYSIFTAPPPSHARLQFGALSPCNKLLSPV
jgi:hypothetical protein